MGDTKTDLLAAAKLFAGVTDNESDELLSLLIDEAQNAVMAYCRIDVMPRQLESFLPLIAAERLREIKNGGVRSLTEGERRVEYGESGADYLSAYADRLRPFVSRAAWLPSDMEAKSE